jgi:hypothetical protein
VVGWPQPGRSLPPLGAPLHGTSKHHRCSLWSATELHGTNTLLGNLMVIHVVIGFPASPPTQNLIILLARVRTGRYCEPHVSSAHTRTLFYLSSTLAMAYARRLQFIPPHPTSLRSAIISLKLPLPISLTFWFRTNTILTFRMSKRRVICQC